VTQADSLFVTVLAGGRPKALFQTVSNACLARPLMRGLRGSFGFVHRPDKESYAVLSECPWVERVEMHAGDPMPIGASTSLLAARALDSGAKYWLHLEDDWNCVRGDDWISEALAALNRSNADSIRLRHSRDGQSRRNAVTHRKIAWRNLAFSCDVASNAHFTFNPSITRCSCIPDVFPACSELEAMQKYQRRPRNTARLLPGAFIHNAKAPSMREATPGSAP